MADWLEIWRIVMVVLGIGLVIFVHELGHFIAARICKVRVEVFSLGFGPRLFAVRRGPTVYQVAAVPLGGFVKMAGDDAWYQPEQEPSPDSLAAKSVGQRFFIYSGGVLANVVFGLVVFPILFANGVEFNEPMIGAPAPGGPAWEAGLQSGTRVLSVNGNSVYSFMHIPNEVALGPGDDCALEVLEPGAEEPRVVHLVPQYSEFEGVYTIGVGPATDPEERIEVLEGGPAWEAGARSGDRLLAVEGDFTARSAFDRLRRGMNDGQPLRLELGRDDEVMPVTITPRPDPQGTYRRIGVCAPLNKVEAVRETPRTAGVDLAAGDLVTAVDGRPVYDVYGLLDGLLAAGDAARVERVRDGLAEALEVPLGDREARIALVSDVALGLDAASTTMIVNPGEAAYRAGMRTGDRIVRIDGAEIEDYEEITRRSRAAGATGQAMVFAVLRTDAAGATRPLEIEVAPEPPPDYGFGLRPATYVFRVDSPLAAIGVGMHSCWKFLQDTWLTLKGIVASRVSPKNLGGPIAIGVYAHSWASAGLAKFFFFLCILSINLAFINVLPIPVLDGGHLFFLIVEKIKGSPVSERVMSFSQLVGLVMIVSLFVFVIYNDVQRHIFG